MKYYFLLFLVIFAAGFMLAPSARAHQPKYITDNQLVIIKQPEVSQAFYGELKGQASYYLIDLQTPQDLFFQILVPDLPGIKKDKTVTVEYVSLLGQPAVSFAKIDPDSADWKNFYEEYGGDKYFAGPSLKKLGEAGYYIIKITSPDNAGKYVLAVGEQERFGAPAMAKALLTLPRLKKNFFQAPLSQWFNGKIVKYFGLGLLIIIILGYMFHKFRRVYK